MLLVFDIGNTNITMGLFDISNPKSAKQVWRLSTIKNQTADEYAVLIMDMFCYSNIKIDSIKAVAAASVVPSLNTSFKEMTKKYFNKDLFFVDSHNCAGLKFKVKNKTTVGADRIANCVAAFNEFGGGVIVIDFGTATTFDCVDDEGSYLGGAIALGPAMSAQALSLKTAQLPHVETKKVLKAIGITTEECIWAGLYFGYIGLIKELIARTKKEMHVNRIIATGGLAYIITDEIADIQANCPNLTLDGIRMIWQKEMENKI
ncbi:MAG: type III pantothenate kinase [Elusimicrobiota bacterium]|jgi:type III pantothenate kinase|nr:type III pantothenate kinase [Elusimicrobiota bacterium]